MSKDQERLAPDEDHLALKGPDFSPRLVCGLIEAAPPFLLIDFQTFDF